MGIVLLFSKPKPPAKARAKRRPAPAAPDTHRAELLHYYETSHLPARTFNEAERERLARMFQFFGISDLDPGGDVDLVHHTALVLYATVSEDARERALLYNTVHLQKSQDWSHDYSAYIEALAVGNRAGVIAGAKALNIAKGIPPGTLSLRAGRLYYQKSWQNASLVTNKSGRRGKSSFFQEA